MTAPYKNLRSLDDWLSDEIIKHADTSNFSGFINIPPTIERLGQPYIYLYATYIFDLEVANGGLDQFITNSSGELAPMVCDALSEMKLREYAAIMAEIISAFGPNYPSDRVKRWDSLDADPVLQELVDRGSNAIDTWSEEFISAREAYAREKGLISQDIQS